MDEIFSVSREKQQLGSVLKVYIMDMGIYSKSWKSVESWKGIYFCRFSSGSTCRNLNSCYFVSKKL